MRFTPENLELVKRRRKIATSRRIESLEYYQSKVGKRSWAIDSSNHSHRFKITIMEVQVLSLAVVKKYHYFEEGYDSPEEFERVWRAIYGDFAGPMKVTFVRFVLGWAADMMTQMLIEKLRPLILTTHRTELARVRFAQRNATSRSGLFKPDELIKLAVERHGDKLAVGWSGGRCSTTALHVALKIKPDIKVIFNDTGVEYPETVQFIKEITKKWNLNLIVVKPTTTFWEIVKKHGFPKMRKYGIPKCCNLLKERPLDLAFQEHGIEAQIDGIRVAESRIRMLSIAQRGQCHFTKSKNIWKYHPVAFMTSKQIGEYESENSVPVNPVYKKYGMDRTGCWPCTGYLLWERVMAKTHPKFFATMKARMGQRVLDHFYHTRIKPPCHTERGGK